MKFFFTAIFDGYWKHISSRVKQSEAKRKKRKESIYHHSLSDSSLGAPRRRFRYNFKQSYEDLSEIDNNTEYPGLCRNNGAVQNRISDTSLTKGLNCNQLLSSVIFESLLNGRDVANMAFKGISILFK